ncbi:hypothetical protein ND860_18705, partial [Leptospira levettii]|nr:hypothetical protein [Leptospira levettii]
VKPKNSQLYLNELSFIKSIKAIGMDRLVSAQRDGFVPNVSRIYPRKNSYLRDQISILEYKPLSLEERIKNKTASVLNHSNPNLGNIYGNAKLSKLISEMKRNDELWKNAEVKYYVKLKEKQYGSLAKRLWHQLLEQKKRKWINLNLIIKSGGLPKRRVLRIVRRWAELKIVSIEDFADYNTDRQGYDYLVKLNLDVLPNLLYQQSREEFENKTKKKHRFIKIKIRSKNYGKKSYR